MPGTSTFFSLLERSAAPRGSSTTELALQDLALEDILGAAADPETVRDAFRTPLVDEAAVRYRQEVFVDLENPMIRGSVTGLAEALHHSEVLQVAARQARQEALRNRLWLSAASGYVAALDTAAAALGSVTAEALCRLRDHVREVTRSAPFTAVRERVAELEAGWSRIRYSVLLPGGRVVVAPFDDEGAVTPDLEAAFAAVHSSEVASEAHTAGVGTGLIGGSLDSVQEWILDAVARLYPEPFADLAAFAAGYEDLIDPGLGRFERELTFYTGYRQLMAPLRARGVAFVLPTVSSSDRTVDLQGVVDVALAAHLAGDGHRPVGNDLTLGVGERILVVSGPNQGGKSTIARLFGQVHHLAAVGCPVPAAAARVPLVDQVLTLFPREERLESLEGGLGEEVHRVHGILESATGRSVLVLNEVFASTTAADARVLLTEVVKRIERLGAAAVCVTFLEEIAELSGATVSVVAEVDPDDAAVRTFRVNRRPADGRAYARSIAERYGLTADSLRRRLAGAGR